MWIKNLLNKSMVESGMWEYSERSCNLHLEKYGSFSWNYIYKNIYFQSFFSYLPEKRKSNSPLNSNNIFSRDFKTEIAGNTETSVQGIVRASANIQDVRLCNNSEQLLVVNCFCKALHLGCLQGSWQRYWSRKYCLVDLQSACMLCY